MIAVAVFPFIVTVAFYSCFFFLWNFPYRWEIFLNTCYIFFAIVSFILPEPSRFILHVSCRLFCQTIIFEMSSLNRNEKFTYENCGTETTRNNIVRHKKRRSAGTLYCYQQPNASTTSQHNLNNLFAKKHSAPKTVVTFKCKLCCQQFPRFYALRQHKNTQHDFLIRKAKSDPDDIINEVDDANLKEELRSCQHFFVDSVLERARDQVFNYAIGNLKAKNPGWKVWTSLYQFNAATKVTLAFGFI